MLKRIRHILGKVYWAVYKYLENKKYRYRKKSRVVINWIIGFFVPVHLNYTGLKKAKQIIICAHPDDETIFFHSVIKQYHPFVICMSNRGDKVRRKEFFNAMNYLGVNGVLLNIPDILAVDWKWLIPILKKKLKKIAKYCDNLEVVYTHNSDGESGHRHHFALSKAVSKVFQDKTVYYTSKEPITENKLSKEEIEDKEYIIKNIYSSQYKMLTLWCPWFPHYMKYEYFEKQ